MYRLNEMCSTAFKSVRARASVRCYDDEPERRCVNIVATLDQRRAGFDKVSVGGKKINKKPVFKYVQTSHLLEVTRGREKKSQSTTGAATGRPRTKTRRGVGSGTPTFASGDRRALPHKKCTCKVLQQTLCIGSNKNT